MNKKTLYSIIPYTLIVVSFFFRFELGAQPSALFPAQTWDKLYGGSESEILGEFILLSDGNYLLGGTSTSGISGDKSQPNFSSSDIWIIKVDRNGVKIWDASFGGSSIDELNSMVALPDGGAIIVGNSISDISGNKSSPNYGQSDVWIIRINQDGQKVWEKTYGGEKGDFAQSIISTYDGGFLVGGSSFSAPFGNTKTAPKQGDDLFDRDMWLIKINADGDKLWDRSYGGSEGDEIRDISTTHDNQYVLAGISRSPSGTGNKTALHYGSSDFWLVKIDQNGNKLWDTSYGGTNDDTPNDLQMAMDGSFLLVGTTTSIPSGNKTAEKSGSANGWAVKVDPNGFKQWDRTYPGTIREIFPSNNSDQFRTIALNENGQFLIGGSDGTIRNRVVLLDLNGDLLADYNYGAESVSTKLAVRIVVEPTRTLIASRGSGFPSGTQTATTNGSFDFYLVNFEGVVCPRLEIKNQSLTANTPYIFEACDEMLISNVKLGSAKTTFFAPGTIAARNFNTRSAETPFFNDVSINSRDRIVIKPNTSLRPHTLLRIDNNYVPAPANSSPQLLISSENEGTSFNSISDITSPTISLDPLVSPNPFSQSFEIVLPFKEPLAQQWDLTIINLQGKVFHQAILTERAVSITSGTWPRGIYVVQFQNNDGQLFTYKLMKQ